MKKRTHVVGLLSIVFCMFFGLGSPVVAQGLDLVGLLTKNLGVTHQQAEGGAGSIFNAASQKMSVEDFSTVTHALPEVKSLMNAAPQAETGSGTIGGLSSMLSQGGSSMGTLTDLAGSFSKLGLGGDMVGKFIPVVLEYAQGKGGDTVANLLKMALQ